ncbi:hypothetical protein ACWEPM_37985 [Streptomyces sp. NPDC004244]
MAPGVFHIAPPTGETTWSLLCRTAARYAQDPDWLLGHWQWTSQKPRRLGGALRVDAEVLLNAAGRAVLAGLCGIEETVPGRALPSWGQGDEQFTDQQPGVPEALWRVGGKAAGPVAFGCRLCVARRTGEAVRVVRYAKRWERVCVRHGRWQLDPEQGHDMEYLVLRETPEVVEAQRRWVGVARRACRAGVGPGEVFGLARAVVCRWWEPALGVG